MCQQNLCKYISLHIQHLRITTLFAHLLQTKPNDIPETARLFSLEIVSTGLASVDTNSSQVDIIVTASDDPHGVVEFGEPSTVTTDESDTTISIPIERNSGLVGDLRVNFSILSSSTATNSEDYTLHNQSMLATVLLNSVFC